MNGFAGRVGGVLVAPRQTLAQVASGEGGFSDVTILLALRLVSGELHHFVRALLGFRGLGLTATVLGLVQSAAALLPDVLGILIGGVAMALFAGAVRGPEAARMNYGKGRELDLAACAWIPYLAVKVVYALVYSALQRNASTVEEGLFDAIAVGWSVAVWAVALWLLRKPPDALGQGAGAATIESADSPPGAAPSAPLSNGGSR